MNGQEEHASGLRGLSTFPKWWGLPVGYATSEEREAWVLQNVITDKTLKGRGLDPAEVRGGKRPRTMSGREALAKVAALP